MSHAMRREVFIRENVRKKEIKKKRRDAKNKTKVNKG